MGDHAAVLAAYAPGLQRLPGVVAGPPPSPLSVESTRARLSRVLRETLCALAAPLAHEVGDRASLILLGGLRARAEWQRGARGAAAAELARWLALVDGTVPSVWSFGDGNAAAARVALELAERAWVRAQAQAAPADVAAARRVLDALA